MTKAQEVRKMMDDHWNALQSKLRNNAYVPISSSKLEAMRSAINEKMNKPKWKWQSSLSDRFNDLT